MHHAYMWYLLLPFMTIKMSHSVQALVQVGDLSIDTTPLLQNVGSTLQVTTFIGIWTFCLSPWTRFPLHVHKGTSLIELNYLNSEFDTCSKESFLQLNGLMVIDWHWHYHISTNALINMKCWQWTPIVMNLCKLCLTRWKFVFIG